MTSRTNPKPVLAWRARLAKRRARPTALATEAGMALLAAVGIPHHMVLSLKLEFEPGDIAKLTVVRAVSMHELRTSLTEVERLTFVHAGEGVATSGPSL